MFQKNKTNIINHTIFYHSYKTNYFHLNCTKYKVYFFEKISIKTNHESPYYTRYIKKTTPITHYRQIKK